MMGDAQIMPLMYFQLNNIPMFKGAYMIVRVEHEITAGNMITRFTGVRVSRNNVPEVHDLFVGIPSGGDSRELYALYEEYLKDSGKEVEFNGRVNKFTMRDFIYSPTAVEKHISNIPNTQQKANIKILVDSLLNPIVSAWESACLRGVGGLTAEDAKITISNGFRTKLLNDSIGGSKSSAHMEGLAVDLTFGNKVVGGRKVKDLFYVFTLVWCYSNNVQFDQIINEPRWVHIGLRARDNRMDGMFCDQTKINGETQSKYYYCEDNGKKYHTTEVGSERVRQLNYSPVG